MSFTQLGNPPIQSTDYGELYINGSSSTVILSTQNTYGLVDGMTTGISSGMTVDTGTNIAYTAVSDGGGGEITVTANAHPFNTGDFISLTNGAYNGVYQVNSISTNTFNVTAVFSATDTGTATRGSSFTCNKADVYDMELAMSVTASANNKTFEFAIFNQGTVLDKTQITRKIGTGADVGALALSSLLDLSVGQTIQFGIRCTDATTANITVESMNFNLHQK